MDAVFPRLFIGSARDALIGPDVIINCAAELNSLRQELPPGHVAWENLDLHDGFPIPPFTVHYATKHILDWLARGKTVAVICGAGRSRSATIILAFLYETGFDWPDGLRFLREKHQEADPNPVLLESVQKAYSS